jgi:hypothetical protein
MATTTPNYGWPVPTSTDYVKDGATAIEALGDAIDATVFGLPTGALTLINSTSFSAVASQSINNVFSATYDNYVLLMNVLTSGNEQVRMRYRVSGADNTTTNYRWHMQFSSSSSTSYVGLASATESYNLLASSEGTSSTHGINLTVLAPFLSENTTYLGLQNGSGTSGGGPIVGGSVQGQFVTTTSFTGFSVFPPSGTITGKIRVYGVQN